jgi:peptidyl-dipeptidase A
MRKSAILALVFALVQGCGAAQSGPPPPTQPAGPHPPAPVASADRASSAPATVPGAEAFIEQVNADLKRLYVDAERMAWVKATYITEDTERLEAQAQERVMEYLSRRILEARRFEGLQLPPELARQFYLLKYSAGLPAPTNAAERAELADIASRLESIYGKGKYCSPKLKGLGKDKASECMGVDELGKVLGEKRDYDLLLEIWRGWHAIATPMRPMYARFVELGNKGAKELGFADMSQIWKGPYDMSADEFTREMERLWNEVRPLYEQLHCYARKKLRAHYGEDKIGKGKAPIPAHLLGNMWAQEWASLYPMLEPYKGKGQPDTTKQLVAQKYDPKKMVELGEKFFVSLGMDPLPKTFWERSMFVKPSDREVVCHASAWDVDMAGDLRIKMCIKIDHEDLVTIHHELGHNYYFHYYNHLLPLFQAGANDGFHEGIGDTLALSVTPPYLTKVGIFAKEPPESPEADLNLLMHRALEGIAFLPFGKLIDEWRWDVFTGKTPAAYYNAAWWKLRQKYQGVAAPVPRSEQEFDPGAKYHIPANVPYTRYFIARILQYQFHRALCKAAGQQGPLHRCSIYGSKEAGQRMIAMLKLGASKPWPEALRVLTGETRMDATAIIDYYKPLTDWLALQNKGETCGWD